MERKFTVKEFAVSFSILFLFQPLSSRVKYTVSCLTTYCTRYQSIFSSAYLNLKYKSPVAPRMFNLPSWIRHLVPPYALRSKCL
jgi:hypothetical protein